MYWKKKTKPNKEFYSWLCTSWDLTITSLTVCMAALQFLNLEHRHLFLTTPCRSRTICILNVQPSQTNIVLPCLLISKVISVNVFKNTLKRKFIKISTRLNHNNSLYRTNNEDDRINRNRQHMSSYMKYSKFWFCFWFERVDILANKVAFAADYKYD